MLVGDPERAMDDLAVKRDTGFDTPIRRDILGKLIRGPPRFARVAE